MLRLLFSRSLRACNGPFLYSFSRTNAKRSNMSSQQASATSQPSLSSGRKSFEDKKPACFQVDKDEVQLQLGLSIFGGLPEEKQKNFIARALAEFLYNAYTGKTKQQTKQRNARSSLEGQGTATPKPGGIDTEVEPSRNDIAYALIENQESPSEVPHVIITERSFPTEKEEEPVMSPIEDVSDPSLGETLFSPVKKSNLSASPPGSKGHQRDIKGGGEGHSFSHFVDSTTDNASAQKEIAPVLCFLEDGNNEGRSEHYWLRMDFCGSLDDQSVDSENPRRCANQLLYFDWDEIVKDETLYAFKEPNLKVTSSLNSSSEFP
eukprot:m.68247 g.68247  ORF g.68247 m.68247 type:complete len:320 (+) comp35503_c1_seq1:25-984(+)